MTKNSLTYLSYLLLLSTTYGQRTVDLPQDPQGNYYINGVCIGAGCPATIEGLADRQAAAESFYYDCLAMSRLWTGRFRDSGPQICAYERDYSINEYLKKINMEESKETSNNQEDKPSSYDENEPTFCHASFYYQDKQAIETCYDLENNTCPAT